MNAPEQLRAQADALLEQIATAAGQLDRVQDEYTRRLRLLQQAHQEAADRAKKQLAAAEKTLRAFLRKHKAALFAGPDDRVELDHGAVLYKLESRVVRAKGMLARLKTAGRTDLIKIAESVDWDRFEPLPDEELHTLGTRRRTKELFDYELRK